MSVEQALMYTWSPQRRARSFELLKGEGARFLAGPAEAAAWKWDLESQVYNVNVGHSNPRVLARIQAQLGEVCAAAPNARLPVRQELAERLCKLSGMAKLFLTTGGSEAVENAIKIARLITGRAKVLTRRNSYHGATMEVLGIAGDGRRDPFAHLLPPGRWIDDPYPAREATGGRPSDLSLIHI